MCEMEVAVDGLSYRIYISVLFQNEQQVFRYRRKNCFLQRNLIDFMQKKFIRTFIVIALRGKISERA